MTEQPQPPEEPERDAGTGQSWMPASAPSQPSGEALEPVTEVHVPASPEPAADEPLPVSPAAAGVGEADQPAPVEPPTSEAPASEPPVPVEAAIEPVAPVAPTPPADPAPVVPAVPAPPPPPFDAPAAANGSSKSAGGLADQRPEIFVGAAFAGGFVAAQILKRLGRR